MKMTAWRLIVMGVSGSGKSTVANALAQRLDLHMVDGDDLHLPQSVAKMRAGIALEDADRWPWLDRIADHLADHQDDAENPSAAFEQGQSSGRVVACSALRRAYRDRLRARAGDLCFLFLQGDLALIEQRMRLRKGHYMPMGLLNSQFQTLEAPGHQETDVITLDISAPLTLLIEQALTALREHKARPCVVATSRHHG